MNIQSEDRLEVPKWSLWLLAPPVLLYFVIDLLYAWLSWRAAVPAPLPVGVAWAGQEMVARTLVITALVTVCAMALLAAGMFALDLLRVFGPTARKRLLIGFGIISGLLAVSLALTFASNNRVIPRMEDYLGNCFFATALIAPSALENHRFDQRSSPEQRALVKSSYDKWTGVKGLCAEVATEIDAAEKPYLLNMLRNLTKAMQAAILLGVPALLVGTISCVARPTALDLPTQNLLKRRQRRRLRRYLYGSALLLTAGMLFMMAWMRWPMFVFEGNKAAGELYSQQVNALGLYFGVSYSLVIAAFYLPVVLIIRLRDTEEQLENAPHAAPSETPVEPILTLGTNVLTKVLAILAPALVSFVPVLADLLNGLFNP